MSAPTLDELESLMSAGDLARLVERLDDLDDATRKRLVKPVRELSRSGEWGDPPGHLTKGLAIVGPAVLPDARSTAAWLRRFARLPLDRDELSFDRNGNRIETLSRTAEFIVEVLVRRNPTWLPTVVAELATRLRFDVYTPDDYLLIESLRTRIGLPPPAVPVFVAMWIRTAWRSYPREVDAVDLVRAEPAYSALVPLAFEVDEIAGALRHRDQLRRLSDTGTVDRDALLDACLARLQRGGRPQPTNEFVHDLGSLEPTSDEVAARTRDYLALLPPGSATSVAAMAQRELLRQHAEGRLDAAGLLEMSQSVLLRTEKKVLRAQLSHLASHARDVPVDADLVARATCPALGNAAPDIQRSAVDLLARLVPDLTPETLAELRQACGALPPDLERRLTSALGSDPTPTHGPRVVALPRPPGPPGPVKPIETVEEVIEELVAIVHSEPLTARGADLDRVVEALPRFAAVDPDALRRAAAPITAHGTYRYYREHGDQFDFTLRRALVVLLASCLSDDWVRPAPDFYVGRRGAPRRAYCVRIFSLARSVQADPRTRVVALPSTLDGSIRPTDLHDRLTRAAAQGWEPDGIDLEQALLRLDLASAPQEPFAALGSPSGARVDEWIRNDGHRPPLVRVEGVREYLDTANMLPQERATAQPRVSPMAHLGADPADPLEVGPLWAELSSWTAPKAGLSVGWDPDAAFETWPLVLPHHRDLVAAHLLPELSRARESRCQGLPALVNLTESGTAGPALLVGLAYAAAGRHQDAQSAAADGLIVLASRGQLDGAAFGELLATMVAGGSIVAKRLVAALGDAARGGAAAQVWTALSRLLAHLLGRVPHAAGIVDLLVLAAEVAPLAGARGTIEGLDELANRRGRSRREVEARRLRQILQESPATDHHA